MANINAIIQFLDDYLVRSHRDYVNAVEANEMLNQAGLLPDRANRRGSPLRKLLRNGLIPHAFQVGSRWRIPLSRLQRPKSTKRERQVRPAGNALIKLNRTKEINMTRLKKQLEGARAKYKPKQVKILLVAEAPPDSIDRFFYYENVATHDWLFLGVAEALYPDLKANFLATGRDPALKKEILSRLQSDGFYLLDLSGLPLTLSGRDLSAQLPRLADKITETVAENTRIILIKANVFDLAYRYLKDAGFSNLINKRIPFPSQGGQALFQAGFKHALALAGFR